MTTFSVMRQEIIPDEDLPEASHEIEDDERQALEESARLNAKRGKRIMHQIVEGPITLDGIEFDGNLNDLILALNAGMDPIILLSPEGDPLQITLEDGTKVMVGMTQRRESMVRKFAERMQEFKTLSIEDQVSYDWGVGWDV